jgi:hypothetical protein
MNFRTILLLGLVVLLVIGLVSILLRRPKVRQTGSATLSPTKIMDRQVQFPAVTQDGKQLVFYSPERESGLYRVGVISQQTELFRLFEGITAVAWSPDRKKALLTVTYKEQEFRSNRSRFLSEDAFDGAATLWAYDMETDRLTQLPVGASSVLWDPNSKLIYYHYFDLTTAEIISELTVRDAFSGTRTKLADIPESASYTIEFLDSNTLFLVPNLSDPSGSTTAYVFDLKTNTLSDLLKNVAKAEASPGGTYILYQPADKSSWHLFERGNGKNADLKIPATNGFISWINDYEFLIVEPAELVSDSLSLVDARTLTSKELTFAPNAVFHLDRIAPTATRTLFFISDDTLYRLELP